MTRTIRTLLAVAGLGALLAGAVATDALAKNDGGGGLHRGRPTKGKSFLTIPEGASDTNAKGWIETKFFPEVGKRSERSWFRVKLRKLDANTTYTLWGDDPATEDDNTDLTKIADVTTGDYGEANWFLDSKKDDLLPFEKSLSDLSGKAFQVRDADGASVVLEGTIP